jgi:hypothetical protein
MVWRSWLCIPDSLIKYCLYLKDNFSGVPTFHITGDAEFCVKGLQSALGQLGRKIFLVSQARVPIMSYPPLHIARFSGIALTEGIEVHHLEGVPVKITNVPKTIADCFKYRHKIGLDVAMEALKEAWNAKRVSMDELWHYGQICRVQNVMRPYLEGLTSR